jgi:hypothetical protein
VGTDKEGASGPAGERGGSVATVGAELSWLWLETVHTGYENGSVRILLRASVEEKNRVGADSV